MSRCNRGTGFKQVFLHDCHGAFILNKLFPSKYICRQLCGNSVFKITIAKSKLIKEILHFQKIEMKECIVEFCLSNSDPEIQEVVTYFNFPEKKGDERFDKWVEAVGKNPEGFEQEKFICSRHFRPEDFDQSSNSEGNGARDVKPNLTLNNKAIPSLYLNRVDEKLFVFSSSIVLETKTENELNISPVKDIKEENVNGVENCNEDLDCVQSVTDGSENSSEESNVLIKEQIIVQDLPKKDGTDFSESTTCSDNQQKENEEAERIQNIDEIKIQNQISSSLKFNCTECGEKFFWSKELKRHKLLIHNSFRCDCCHKRFLKISNLKYHKRKKHNLLEAFQCDSCDQAFFRAKELWIHLKTHKEVETDKCKKCREKFQSKEDFYKHKCRYINSPFQCKICKRTFLGNLTMETHMKKYHTGKPEPAKPKETKKQKCDVCGKFYKHLKSLKLHKLSHTNSYKCDKCEKTFSGRSQLKSHQLTHMGVECFNLGQIKY